MAKTRFHLGWFVMKGYGPKGWRSGWGGSNPHSWVKPDLLVHLAKELERAAFDYVTANHACRQPVPVAVLPAELVNAGPQR